MVFSIVVFIISIILYLFRPVVYSHSYCIALFIVFAISTIWFIKKNSYGNYFNFHSLFFLGYFLTYWVYPVFIYPYDKSYISFYHYSFQEGIILKSTALALLGASSYILGAAIMNMKDVGNYRRMFWPINYKQYIPILRRFTYLFFFLFLIVVGPGFYRGIFNSETSMSNYFLIGFQTFITLTVILVCYSHSNQYKGTVTDFLKKFKPSFLAFIILFIVFFFIVGNRGPALQLLLILVSIYSLFVHKIKFSRFLGGAFIGMIVMTFISNARVTRTSGYTGNTGYVGYFERGIHNMQINSIFDIGGELISGSRILYFDVDYTDKRGVNYGKTMLSPIIAIIPGAGSYLGTLFDIDKDQMTSSKLISSMILGKDSTWGIGASIIGDIYMSFGTFGIILFMLFFGYINNRFQLYAIHSDNIYYLIAYLVSISFSIYYSRSGYFIPFRVILWPIIILYILKHFKGRKYTYGL